MFDSSRLLDVRHYVFMGTYGPGPRVCLINIGKKGTCPISAPCPNVWLILFDYCAVIVLFLVLFLDCNMRENDMLTFN